MKIDNDRLINASAEQVAAAAARLADAVQDLPPEVRLLGSAAYTKLVFEQFDVPPQDPMTIVGNLMSKAEAVGVRTFAALKEYLRSDF